MCVAHCSDAQARGDPDPGSPAPASREPGGAAVKGTNSGKVKVKGDSSDKTVRIKVRSKRLLDFRRPHESCGGFNPLKYTIRREGSRGSSGGKLDLVLDWTVSVAGRFKSQTNAPGTLSYHLKHHLECSSTHKPYVPPGGTTSEEDCGQHTGTWTAKR
jgi:hypothetical protein